MNVNITGKLFNAEGEPIAKGYVTIKLSNASYVPSGVYQPVLSTFETDEDGSLNITLWANEEADYPTHYEAHFPGNHLWEFTLDPQFPERTWSQVMATALTSQDPNWETITEFIVDIIEDRLATGGVFPTDSNGSIIIDGGII